MEQERISSDKGAGGRGGFWAIGLFTLVPLAAILIFINLEDENADGIPHVQARPESVPVGRGPALSTTAEVREQRGRPTGEITRGEPKLDPGMPTRTESVSPTNASPHAAEDAARLVRFDQNARSFDERLAAFDREQDRGDDTSSVRVEEGLKAALRTFYPNVQVVASCTYSVCVVELSGPESVGTMIAKIAPWIRTHSLAATGDPANAADESSMRLAFDKADALAEFGTADRDR